MDLVMDEWMALRHQAILADWPEAKIIIVTSFIDDEKYILQLKLVRPVIC